MKLAFAIAMIASLGASLWLYSSTNSPADGNERNVAELKSLQAENSFFEENGKHAGYDGYLTVHANYLNEQRDQIQQ